MKPLNQFNEKIVTITLVASSEHASSVKGMLETLGLTISNEDVIPSGETVFVIKDMELGDLSLFDRNNPAECYVHYYELTTDNFKVFFHSSYTKTNIGQINIMHVYEKDGQPRTHTIADIFEERQIGDKHPTGYTINWGAWGSQDVETTRIFSNGLRLAVDLAELQTKKFVK